MFFTLTEKGGRDKEGQAPKLNSPSILFLTPAKAGIQTVGCVAGYWLKQARMTEHRIRVQQNAKKLFFRLLSHSEHAQEL